MFYDKSKQEFSLSHFKNPDSAYRAAPFWAWNTKLDKDELMRQIEIFKKMCYNKYVIKRNENLFDK